MSDITYFAKTNFRNQQSVFGIKTDDRRRHMYIIGKTGMGKTTLLEHLVIQDIRNGHGVAYVDPHGDTSEKIISMIPPERLKDVIYFNPADQAFPIAFNVMEQVSAENRSKVSSGLIGVFKKLWADSWGPRLEYILRNTILALMETPDSTLLGVMRMMSDKKYREQIVANVTDPVVKAFWVGEFSKWNDKVLQEVVSPIQNKVGQFLSSSLIRNIVGQTKSSFSIRDVMDGKKILVINLSKGRIGEDISALIGAMMITKIQIAAMERVDIPENDRHDFYLYVDEFQNFATESFANILSEARKYRLNLILANQYITQIDEIVRDAIFGNVGTLVSFRVGAADAEFLEKEFEPVFMMNDIVNLPKYEIYLKLMIDGIAGDAFSATTLPPVQIREGEGDTTEQVCQQSREQYTISKEKVDEDIRLWSGMMMEATLPPPPKDFSRWSEPRRSNSLGNVDATKVSQVANVPVQSAQPRKLYDAKCDSCSVAIQIPFQPDGSRPTFCKDCLKEYQRYSARKRESSSPQNTQQQQHSSVRDTASRTRDDARPLIRQDVPKSSDRMVYGTRNQSIKLNQAQHIAPKKFTPIKKNINIGEVRSFLKQVANEKPSDATNTQSNQ